MREGETREERREIATNHMIIDNQVQKVTQNGENVLSLSTRNNRIVISGTKKIVRYVDQNQAVFSDLFNLMLAKNNDPEDSTYTEESSHYLFVCLKMPT